MKIEYYLYAIILTWKKTDVIESSKIDIDKLSKMALEDPSTSTNPKKMTIDDMKILYEYSISGKLF